MIRTIARLPAALAVLALVLPASVRGEETDDRYIEICKVVFQGDLLNGKGHSDQATGRYQDAEKSLLGFRKVYPNWNTKIVSYRLSYLAEKLTGVPAPGDLDTVRPASNLQPEAENPSGTSAGPAKAELKLLEPGAEPRKVLRFRLKAGDTQTLDMTVTMGMEIKAGQMDPQSIKLPAIHIVNDATVKSVSPDGDISYDSVVKDISCDDESGASPQIAALMKSALAGLKGMSVSAMMSSRGLAKNVDLKVPSGADPQIRPYADQISDSFANLKSPLPDEPVGPGARWETRTPVKSEGMTIDQTVTYKLLSVEGDVISLQSAITQHAANQKVQSPMMPGVKVDLTKMTGTGTGNCKIDLGQALPVEGALDLHTDMAMAMNAGSQKQTVNMKLDMKLELGAK